MPRFEYRVVTRDLSKTGIAFVDELNECGEAGWEVVSVLEPNGLGFEHILLKREKFERSYGRPMTQP